MQNQVNEGVMATILAKETEMADFIAATDKQLAEVDAKLVTLCLAKQDQGETEDDRTSATKQVAIERAALGESHSLLKELLSIIQIAE